MSGGSPIGSTTSFRPPPLGWPAAGPAASRSSRRSSVGGTSPRCSAGSSGSCSAPTSTCLLYSTGDPSEEHRVPPHRRLRRRVDGVLVIGLPADSPDLQELFELDMPVTLIGAHSVGVSSVSIDDVEGGRMATQHLINLGHERIGLISGPAAADAVLSRERPAGRATWQALEASGSSVEPSLQVPGYFTIEGGEHAMTAQLAQRTPPTAVFAMSDEMAFGRVAGAAPPRHPPRSRHRDRRLRRTRDVRHARPHDRHAAGGGAWLRCGALPARPARRPRSRARRCCGCRRELCVRGSTTLHRTVGRQARLHTRAVKVLSFRDDSSWMWRSSLSRLGSLLDTGLAAFSGLLP